MAQDKLTRETVVEQALALADEEGIGAVTIRRLATRLGVTPMALYWHFKNKDELMWVLAEYVMNGVTADVSPGDPWEKRLRVMVEALVNAMREHDCLPDLLASLEKHHLTSFNRATEAALAALGAAGFTLREGYYVSTYLLNGAIGLVQSEPGRHSGPSEEERAEARRQRRLKLESMPVDRYPNMVAYGSTLAEPPDIEQYYTFGVDLLISGVQGMRRGRGDGR
ncbi:TetR/AcrR family transcriptional regulator [Sphaerisporangium fuscum]|uniref:TetR/AcrR family transcriptional regulator n=1 Tax=Sphaerisporangium fuscum TaxID=2835868 RepID=UPI001BDCCE47|nr:TetR family transcriptional regulator [Sphaerisporangium fuscum]